MYIIKNMKTRIKQVAMGGVFLALAIVAGYIEKLFPFDFGIPGIKIGLANAVTVGYLYTVSFKSAAAFSLVRVFITSILFGTPVSFIYSFSGAAVSVAVMGALKKTNYFSQTAVSTVGGAVHNTAQLTAAALLLKSTAVFYYAPFLIAAGSAAGFATGTVSAYSVKAVKRKSQSR